METVEKYFRAFKIKHIKEINSKELLRRYRILAKKYHPDHGGTAAQFRFVHSAFKYLKTLLEGHIKKQDKKFFNNNRYSFYGDNSIYDIKEKRWIRFKGKNIKIKG